MSTTLTPVITHTGLQSVFNASHTGLTAEITHIVLGDVGYNPTPNRTRLARERLRVPVADGKLIGTKQLHVTAMAEGGASEFWVREVGFIANSEFLLAVWSHDNQPLAYKARDVDLLLAFDLVFDALPANSVIIQETGQNLNLVMATELVQLATAQIETMHRQLTINDRLSALEKNYES